MSYIKTTFKQVIVNIIKGPYYNKTMNKTG